MLWYKNIEDVRTKYRLYLCNNGLLYADCDLPVTKSIAYTPLIEDQYNDFNNGSLKDFEIENWVYQKAQFIGVKKLFVQTNGRKYFIKWPVSREYLSLDEAMASIDEGFIKNEYGCEKCAQEHKQLRDWLMELKVKRLGGIYPRNTNEYLPLDEAIKHLDEMFDDDLCDRPWPSDKVMREHKQLRDWLMELRERRSQR